MYIKFVIAEIGVYGVVYINILLYCEFTEYTEKVKSLHTCKTQVKKKKMEFMIR